MTRISQQEMFAMIREHLAKISVVLELNTKSLEEHIKRTNMLESRLQQIENDILKWKGALMAASLIFGLITAAIQLLMRMYFH